VTRRYRDFLWIYSSLHANNPGVVVPPPPEKQAVGRFDTNFVESRRAALERMLNKTAAHPTLQHDSDLKLFLESEAFNVDVKHKERKEPGLGESKGMFSGLTNISVGGGGKFIEQDDVSRFLWVEKLLLTFLVVSRPTDIPRCTRESAQSPPEGHGRGSKPAQRPC
jgi:sorting nexin-1/2